MERNVFFLNFLAPDTKRQKFNETFLIVQVKTTTITELCCGKSEKNDGNFQIGNNVVELAELFAKNPKEKSMLPIEEEALRLGISNNVQINHDILPFLGDAEKE